MVQPVRPQDVSNVYLQQAASSSRGAQPGTPGADASGASGGARRTDRVQLSDEAMSLRRVFDSVASQPDVRDQRIAGLRDQIANGTYDLGLPQVASRLVDEGLVQ